MSRINHIEIYLSKPVVASKIIASLLKGDWQINRDCSGATPYVPLGGDVGDWEMTDLSDRELLNVCDLKQEHGELASIEIVHNGVGGSLLIWSDRLGFSLNCDFNTRYIAGGTLLDANWYLLRLLGSLKIYRPMVSKIQVTCE